MNEFDLNTILINFPITDNKVNEINWTARHAVEGVQIFGGIGSGKTSGSGRMLALKYLSAGFGGLVLTAKPDEKELWEEYCALTGRSDDLIIVEPGGKYFFNFLDYEAEGKGAVTENIVQVLKTVIRAGDDKGDGGSTDPFWETALDMLLFHVIDLCRLAYGKVSVKLMYEIVQSLPKPGSMPNPDKPTAYESAVLRMRDNIWPLIEKWEQEHISGRASLDDIPALYQDLPDARTADFVNQFFNNSFKNLNERTRSIIEFSFSGFLFQLLREPVYSLFCNNPSNFSPEDCLKGKIILLNLPVKTYHKVGRDTQIMFKYIWQRAMEKRPDAENGKPVFLWADEAQNFLHEHDAEYQATARSSRIITTYISQNLPNYHASMGGKKSEFRVKSFLGTLGTKIFHANADIETNSYASELIGDTFFEEIGRSLSFGSKDANVGNNRNLKIDKAVRPEEFSKLKTGGKAPLVQAFIHLQANDPNHFIANFSQTYMKPQN